MEFSVSENCAIMPSGFYVKLQMIVHHAASSPDKITANELNEFLELTNAFLDQPGLTTTPMMDRVLGLMILQLILLLSTYRNITQQLEKGRRVTKNICYNNFFSSKITL